MAQFTKILTSFNNLHQGHALLSTDWSSPQKKSWFTTNSLQPAITNLQHPMNSLNQMISLSLCNLPKIHPTLLQHLHSQIPVLSLPVLVPISLCPLWKIRHNQTQPHPMQPRQAISLPLYSAISLIPPITSWWRSSFDWLQITTNHPNAWMLLPTVSVQPRITPMPQMPLLDVWIYVLCSHSVSP